MDKVVIFVDDGFFGLVKNHFQKEFGKKNKYLQTFRNICDKENLDLEHIFIYLAPPYQSKNPTKLESRLMSNYQRMVKMLKKKNWITLREGRCLKNIDSNGDFHFYQKGVDALVIMDMYDLRETFPDVSKIILIASDSDFVPVIKRMKDKGIKIILYTYFDRVRNSKFSTSNYLKQSCSKWVKLKSGDFR
ncbi:NYN domain-containing protein [archaeon]|nr:NYN domain-containing protein [archaeon]